MRKRSFRIDDFLRDDWNIFSNKKEQSELIKNWSRK